MKKLVILLLTVCLLCASVACSDKSKEPEQTDKPPGEGILELVCSDQEWEGSNIYLMTTGPPTHGFCQDPVFIREPDGSYTPNVAKSYEISEDGKLLTVILQDDLQFFDGTSVTGNDLKRSIEWGQEVSVDADDYAAITRVEAEGNTVYVHMDGGYSSSVLFYLAGSFMPIVSAEDIDNLSEEDLLWKARIYGPYYVDEYVSGDHVTLKANPFYKTVNTHLKNKGAPKVDTITVRFMTEQFPIVQAFLSGEMDISSKVVQESFGELEAAPVKIVSQPSDGVFSLLLNNDCELFQDERVRKAIMYMIDRDQIVDYSDGTISTAYSLLAKTCRGYDATVEDWFKENYVVSNGQEKATELLKEAGWVDTDGDGVIDKDGKPFKFTIVDYSGISALNNILQIQFQNIGIDVTVNTMEFAQYREEVTTTDRYEAAISRYYWSEGATTLPNIVRDANVLPENTKYYELCLKASETTNDDESKAFLSEAQKILLNTTYYIPVANPNWIMVFSNRIADTVYYNEAMWRIWLSDIE